MGSNPPLTREQLQQLLSVRNTLDAILESSLINRQSMAQTAQKILEATTLICSAEASFLQTYNEDLELTLYTHPAQCKHDLSFMVDLPAEHEQKRVEQTSGAHLLTSAPLDVAGGWFGRFGVVISKESPLLQDGFLYSLLDEISEEIDDFIAPIFEAREKHQLIMRLSDALWSPVLELGLQNAARVLSVALSLRQLLIVYRADKESAPAQLYVFDKERPEIERSGLSQEAQGYLERSEKELLARLQIDGAREEVLLAGSTQRMVIGRLVATGESDFCTFDRDLIASFSELLRQRLVDYGKEWRKLTESFSSKNAAKLLSHHEYEKKFLFPQEKVIAILYADLSGFTKISETALKSPHDVSDLIEAWSRAAVQLVWDEGGVFDKMVGDCVIALFGPPFYEGSEPEYLSAALRCSLKIREMTRSFHQRPELAHLNLPELGVATGVNVALSMTGYFGPNSNFTCFSSGMNNTARLQGCATKHEILVMSEAIGALRGFQFGEERHAQVKNVAEPLHFRALIG